MGRLKLKRMSSRCSFSLVFREEIVGPVVVSCLGLFYTHSWYLEIPLEWFLSSLNPFGKRQFCRSTEFFGLNESVDKRLSSYLSGQINFNHFKGQSESKCVRNDLCSELYLIQKLLNREISY